MNVVLIVLKNGTVLISESDQLEYEPKGHRTKPHTLSGKAKLVLSSWPEYTDDTHVLLRSDDLLTVCEPQEKLLEAYAKKLGKTLDDLIGDPPPVIMSEEPEYQEPQFEDDYEPNYV